MLIVVITVNNSCLLLMGYTQAASCSGSGVTGQSSVSRIINFIQQYYHYYQNLVRRIINFIQHYYHYYQNLV